MEVKEELDHKNSQLEKLRTEVCKQSVWQNFCRMYNIIFRFRVKNGTRNRDVPLPTETKWMYYVNGPKEPIA